MRIIIIVTITFFYLACGCTPFNFGLTEERARDRFTLVSDSAKNYGKKRIGHVKKFYGKSQLAWFLDKKGNPDFFYEYKTPAKCRGIKLYYPVTDSAFIFEEPSKGNLAIYLKEARKMDTYERETYVRLKNM